MSLRQSVATDAGTAASDVYSGVHDLDDETPRRDSVPHPQPQPQPTDASAAPSTQAAAKGQVPLGGVSVLHSGTGRLLPHRVPINRSVDTFTVHTDSSASRPSSLPATAFSARAFDASQLPVRAAEDGAPQSSKDRSTEAWSAKKKSGTRRSGVVAPATVSQTIKQQSARRTPPRDPLSHGHTIHDTTPPWRQRQRSRSLSPERQAAMEELAAPPPTRQGVHCSCCRKPRSGKTSKDTLLCDSRHPGHCKRCSCVADPARFSKFIRAGTGNGGGAHKYRPPR